MDKKDKIIIALLCVIIAVLSIGAYTLFSANSTHEPISVGEKFEIYNTEPQSMTSYLSNYGNDSRYDQSTISWLRGLGDSKVVFMTPSEWIIMNRSDAKKLDTLSTGDYTNDLAWKNTMNYLEIECDVLEIRSMGDGYKDCVLVDNVKVVGNRSSEWLPNETNLSV